MNINDLMFPVLEIYKSEVRRLVLKDFRDWHGWESRDYFDELKAAVEKATSVAEIIRLIAS